MAAYRVPSWHRSEATLPVARAAASGNDVSQSREALGVQEWVQESQRALSGIQKAIVEKRNDGREGCTRGTRAVDALNFAVDQHRVLDALRGHIRVCATGGVDRTCT